jgi:hypothetical protein
MRHLSLILMLNCPSRLPFSFSNLLAGGIFKSIKVFELLIILSFLSATCWMSRGSLFDPARLYIFSVSMSLNDLIIYLLAIRLYLTAFNVKRYIIDPTYIYYLTVNDAAVGSAVFALPYQQHVIFWFYFSYLLCTYNSQQQ